MSELALSTPPTPPESFGRYLLYPAIARGGMATVHTARLVGADGFTRLVAAKRLHPQFTDDPDFVTMFHDEACIASRIHHPNVVPVLDVVVSGHELILVQEYVNGVPLSQLMKMAQLAEEPIAVDLVIAVLAGVLSGLHAAHEVRDESGRALEIVHRDVSPQNIMISVDGIPRLLDFGIAKARTSTHHTREGVFKGKLAYMAPEQLRMEPTARTIDVYAAGVLAWEMLVNRRVHDGRHDIAFVTAVMSGEIPPITSALHELRDAVDDQRWAEIVALEPIVSRAMSALPEERFATADEMLHALIAVRPSATSMEVADWVRTMGSDFLDARQRTLAANEESWRRTSVYVATPASGTQVITQEAPRVSAPPPMSIPPPTPRLRGDKRLRRALPWIGAGTLVLAGLVGGLLQGTPDQLPKASQAHPAPTVFVPHVEQPAPEPTSAPALSNVPVPVPVPVPGSVRLPPVLRAPPPAPPRPWSPPPTPAPPTSTTTSTTMRSDCNPPFFFEGTKKVFKPSCL